MKISFNKKLAANKVSSQSKALTNKCIGRPEIASAALVEATLKLVAEHGDDPGTKPQAAAHEAGHVVVAHALGWTVKGAKLIKHHHFDKVRWGGSTYHKIPGYEEPKYCLIAEHPAVFFQTAITDLAGYFGECTAGLEHPVSSLDERAKAMNTAAALNRLWGNPEGYTESVIGKVCQYVIESNRQQFDIIRAHLYRTGKLNRSDARRMLVHVTPCNINSIFERVAP
jgi:hypothetical protein